MTPNEPLVIEDAIEEARRDARRRTRECLTAADVSAEDIARALVMVDAYFDYAVMGSWPLDNMTTRH